MPFNNTQNRVAITILCTTLAWGCGKKDDEAEAPATVSIPSINFTVPDPAGAALTNAEPGIGSGRTFQ